MVKKQVMKKKAAVQSGAKEDAPAVPTVHEELFKKYFLKGQDKEEAFKQESDKASEGYSQLIDKLRDEAVADVLTNARSTFVPKFRSLAKFVSVEEYEQVMKSVAAEVQSVFRSNGMSDVLVEAHREGDAGDRVTVTNVLNFFLEYEKKSEIQLPKPLTGLDGKCCVCLEDDVKLYALNPCGHCVCLDCTTNFIGKECPTCKAKVVDKQGVFPN